jgi:glutathione S-transferase
MIAAHETGLAGRIECMRSLAAFTQPNPDIMRDNPLSKIPTLVLDDGSPLYDSPVICEYLDGLHDGPRLFPADGPARFTALRRQALADGLLDTLILWRGERMRPEALRSTPHLDAFRVKTVSALDALDREAAALGADPFTIGHLAIGVALDYLTFRFEDFDWRSGRPALVAWHATFAARPSVAAVPIVDDYEA